MFVRHAVCFGEHPRKFAAISVRQSVLEAYIVNGLAVSSLSSPSGRMHIMPNRTSWSVACTCLI